MQFRVFNTNARKLITANLLFGLFNPFYIIFSNTFIFGATHGDLYFNLMYSIFTFIGIVTGFIINGHLMRFVHIKKLLILGVGLLFMSITVMFLLPKDLLSGVWIFVFGTATGIGSGVYWSSRNYLTLLNTNDNNRDFFSGLDYVLISFGRVITPLLIGFYIGFAIDRKWFNHGVAYQSSLIFAFVLILLMSFIVLPRKFKTANPQKFLYFKFPPLWRKMRKFTLILGVFQGAFFALPPILILQYIGNEKAVGAISSISYTCAVVIVYFISRRSKSSDRTRIFFYGLVLLTLASVFFSFFLARYSQLATIVLMVSMFVCEPILNFPFRATFMKAIDMLKDNDTRDAYAYVIDIEIVSGIGRVLGICLFIGLYNMLAVTYALPIYMVLLSAIQFFNLRYSKQINGA